LGRLGDLHARTFSARNVNQMGIAFIIILASIKNVPVPGTLRRDAEKRKKFLGVLLFKVQLNHAHNFIVLPFLPTPVANFNQF